MSVPILYMRKLRHDIQSLNPEPHSQGQDSNPSSPILEPQPLCLWNLKTITNKSWASLYMNCSKNSPRIKLIPVPCLLRLDRHLMHASYTWRAHKQHSKSINLTQQWVGAYLLYRDGCSPAASYLRWEHKKLHWVGPWPTNCFLGSTMVPWGSMTLQGLMFNCFFCPN